MLNLAIARAVWGKSYGFLSRGSWVITWVEDGHQPDRSELPDGDPDLLTYHVLFGRLRIDAHRGLVYDDGGRGQVCLPSEYF